MTQAPKFWLNQFIKIYLTGFSFTSLALNDSPSRASVAPLGWLRVRVVLGLDQAWREYLVASERELRKSNHATDRRELTGEQTHSARAL